ncbi:ABC transporter permease [Microbacterium sp. 1.5R]|uniref:ABC transporter permease n=1 Tax=Microbacterium sp. 1.5R TaxID=1916917 RepID=UPI0011A3F5EC|nr:ABC transporter permease [Microbacterium sp. 1.5R]
MSVPPLALYIGRRVLTVLVLLLFISFVVFSLLYLAPGSAVDILLGNQPRTPETVAALEAKYHLDQPFLTQYWIWLEGALRFDFGESIQSTLPVADEIISRFPVTIFLALFAFVLEMTFGITIGVITALRQQSALDRGLVTMTVVGVSTPAFVSGIFVLFIFSITLGWFPAFGAGEPEFFDRLWHLALPALSLAIVGSAFIVKHTRAAVIAVVDQDFVAFARARGLTRSEVLFRYILRNAMIPILGVTAMTLVYLLIGAVFVEVTYSVSGLGQLIVQAANAQDMPMIQGTALVIATIVMGFTLLADLAYMAADPRIRKQVLA